MSRKIIALFAILSFSQFASAQSGVVGISPAPILPSDGDTSRFPGHYVFLDLRSAAYVVSYISQDTGERITARFGAHSLSDPKITIHISADTSGVLHYSYDIANGPHARQAIQKVRLLVPSDDTTAQAKHAPWQSDRTASNVWTMAAPNLMFTPVGWSGKNGQVIAPGSTLAAFSVDSSYLPGFTYILAEGATDLPEYSPSATAKFPKEAADQLAAVFAQGWDIKRTLTLGPRFSKAAAPPDVVANLIFGINAMVQHKELDSSSPFVQAVLSALSNYLENEDLSRLGTLQEITSKPNPGLESQIATVLRLDLGQNVP